MLASREVYGVGRRGWEQASPHARGREMHVANVTGSFSVSDTHWQTVGMETMQTASLPARGCSSLRVFLSHQVLNVLSDQVAHQDGYREQSVV